MLQLQHRFRDSIQSAGGASRLAGGEHPAPGIEGKASLRDIVAHEARKIAARDHAEIVELREHHGRVVVVDRGDIDIFRAHASGPPQLAGEGADAGLQAVALLIVVVEARAVRTHAHGRADARTAIGMSDDDGLRARDHRHAVVARQRVGDQRRGEIVLHGHRGAVHGVGVVRRPCALRDGEVAVIGFLQAVRLHLPAGHQRVDAVRPAVAERRQVQLGHDVEIGGHLGIAAQPGGIPAGHQDHRRGASLDGAQRVPQHVHGGGAAVGVLDEPAQR